MSYPWPPRTQIHTKEMISSILWILKLEGDIDGPGDAVRILIERLAAHGVEIHAPQGFRLLLREMEGGRYGDLIVRKINGRRTKAIRLYADELPENYLPDAGDAGDAVNDANDANEDADGTLWGVPFAGAVTAEPEPSPEPELVAEPSPEHELEPALVEPPVPEPPVQAPRPHLTLAAAPVRAAEDDFDIIAAGLEAELDELRRTIPPVERVPVMERVAQGRQMDDKADVLSAILSLVGDLAIMVAGEPTKAVEDTAVLDRLADAVERAERFRRRALEAEETAKARAREAQSLAQQVSVKEAMIARLDANLTAALNGERINDAPVKAVQRFISERPHERRAGESNLVYSVG